MVHSDVAIAPALRFHRKQFQRLANEEPLHDKCQFIDNQGNDITAKEYEALRAKSARNKSKGKKAGRKGKASEKAKMKEEREVESEDDELGSDDDVLFASEEEEETRPKKKSRSGSIASERTTASGDRRRPKQILGTSFSASALCTQ